MRLNATVLKVIIALLLWRGGAGLYAQEAEGPEEEIVEVEEPNMPRIQIVKIPPVKVHVTPVRDGTEEEAAYFKANFEAELIGSGYAVTEDREGSDFYMELLIERDADEDPPNVVTVYLYNTLTGREITRIGRSYNTLADMEEWNLVLMYQAMANAPIVKMVNNAELEGVYVRALAPKEPHQPAFYAGLRAGASLNLYTFQTSGGYGGGTGRSFSVEAALLLEFHPFRFFSVQAEAVALYEKFGESREIREGESVSRSTGVFTALSLQIPILFKAPVTLGRLSLAPFAGIYFILPLGPMTADFGGGSASYAYRADPPLGLSLGADLSLPLSYGKVFLGLRGDLDLGTRGEGREIPAYSRSRLCLTLGIAWKAWTKGKAP